MLYLPRHSGTLKDYLGTNPNVMEKTFDQLLHPITSSLRAFAYSFTKNADDADDLYQETVLKAFRYYTMYVQGSNFKAWLFTIMRNTFINDFRRDARRNKVMTVKEEFSSQDLSQSSNSNTATGALIIGDVNRMLAILPEAYLIPFQRHFEGYKYYEIAEELNIPLGTVKTRIHVAREILKKRLRPYA